MSERPPYLLTGPEQREIEAAGNVGMYDRMCLAQHRKSMEYLGTQLEVAHFWGRRLAVVEQFIEQAKGASE